MTKRLGALLLAVVMVFTMLASCSAKTPAATETVAPTATDEPSVAPTTEPTEESTTQSFTDSVGREVELPANITKISPSGALAQMFLISIAPDLLCTIASKYSDDALAYLPAYLNDLPEVGQFYGSDDLNFETIASIAPEVVIDIGEPKATIVEDMDSITEKLAIPAVHITADLKGSADAFRTLGKLLNREERGEEIAQYIEKIYEQTANIVDAVGDNKVGVLYLLGDQGLNVIPQTSFHAEVLDWLTNNLAVVDSPSSKGSGNETDLEQIANWNPEYIIFGSGSVYDTVAADPVWSTLSAISSGKYVECPAVPYSWFGSPPSINRYLSMIWLPTVLYPEQATYDVEAEIKEYYQMMYSTELTADAYAALTANAYIK